MGNDVPAENPIPTLDIFRYLSTLDLELMVTQCRDMQRSIFQGDRPKPAVLF